MSKDLCEANRVVVLFGEGLQQLGVLAHRVISGQGGVDEGSVVSLVKALLGSKNKNDSNNNGEAAATENDTETTKTGVILANTGERWWWPQGQRALAHRDSLGVKMKSCVHKTGSFNPAINLIPGSEDVGAHVRSVFERVLANDDDHDKEQEEEQVSFVAPGARIQIIAVGEAATAVETYLDQNWGRWKGKVDCLAMLGDGKPVYDLDNEGFKKFLREVSGVPVSDVERGDQPSAVFSFSRHQRAVRSPTNTPLLPQRARIYITAQAPLDTPLSNPEGNPNSMSFTSYGCPVLSSGEVYYVELTLIKAKDVVLAFLDDTYKAGRDGDNGGGSGGNTYVNPVFEITYAEEDVPETPCWDVSEPGVASSEEC